MSSLIPESRFSGVKTKEDPFGNPMLVLPADSSVWLSYPFGILLAAISAGLATYFEIGRVATVVTAFAVALIPRFLAALQNYTCLRMTPWEIQLIRGRLFFRRARSAPFSDLGEITYEPRYEKSDSSSWVIVLKWKDDSEWRINSRLNTAEHAQWIVEQLRTWIQERSRARR